MAQQGEHQDLSRANVAIKVLLFEGFNTITCTEFSLQNTAPCKTPTPLMQLIDLLKIQGKILRFFVFRKEQIVLQLSPTFHLSFITMATMAVSSWVKQTIFSFPYPRLCWVKQHHSLSPSQTSSRVFITLACKLQFKNYFQESSSFSSLEASENTLNKQNENSKSSHSTLQTEEFASVVVWKHQCLYPLWWEVDRTQRPSLGYSSNTSLGIWVGKLSSHVFFSVLWILL